MRTCFHLLGIFCLFTKFAAADTLTIISPHRKSIQKEFIAAFEARYTQVFGTKVEVDWIDQGGTESDVRYVISKYTNGKATSGIDVFWGGGEMALDDLVTQGLLEAYKLPGALDAQIPQEIAGITVKYPKGYWYGTALSSFGIFYNKKILKMQNIKSPETWADLANPYYFEQIAMTDPRHSASALVMSLMILEVFGWEKGWQVLTQVAANTKKFSHSSSDPIKAVVSGDVAIAPAIDFYAYPQIEQIGADNLGFVLPVGQTAYNSDPIAILKGAPNRVVAERFINFVLSKDAQKLYILPKGAVGGPKFSTLGRMGVNRISYDEIRHSGPKVLEPFSLAKNTFSVDLRKLATMKTIFGDLYGTTLVDNHRHLTHAWKQAIAAKKDAAALVWSVPSESEIVTLAGKWSDNTLRNQKINDWEKTTRQHFAKK